MMTTVRKLGPGDEDLVRLLSVEDARFDTDPPAGKSRQPLEPAAAARLLSDASAHFLVAFEGPEAVGFLLGHQLLRRHGDERMAMLYEIGVRADRRRRGVGRVLLDGFAALCRARRIGEAFVLTSDSTPGAPAFYAACGWTRQPDGAVTFEIRPSGPALVK
jgi:ribosomal protein S18 acetylase RimI-like enzyme